MLCLRLFYWFAHFGSPFVFEPRVLVATKQDMNLKVNTEITYLSGMRNSGGKKKNTGLCCVQNDMRIVSGVLCYYIYWRP